MVGNGGDGSGFRISGAGYTVGATTILAPVDLELSRGRVHALIGHNGSGKSTLVKLIARQLTPTTGGIAYAGRPLGQFGARAFARAVAYLPQQSAAAEGVTVRELVGFGRYAWHGPFGRRTAADEGHVAEALALAGLDNLADRLVETLSGGERQRANIAMLVAQDAGFILLDEPISALDIGHQLEVLTLVRMLAVERGTGVLAVLHDVNMAARFSDEIIALKGGRVRHRGAPAEIMRPDVLEAIFDVPMHVLPAETGRSSVAYAR